MVRNFWLVLVGVILFMTGCETPRGGAKTDGESTRVVAVTAEHLDWITDVQWTLERMVVGGRAYSLTGDRPYVQFGSDGRVTGFGSVNRFFGLMQIEAGGRVRWPGALASTKMAGPPPLMRQEDAFMKAIQTVEQWNIEGIRLYGRDAEGLTELGFRAPVQQ
jgi:heat shock protein HslJ